MFDSLRKKFTSWLNKPRKKEEKKEKSTEKPEKKKKTGKEKKSKIIKPAVQEEETPTELKKDAEIQEENIELELKEEKIEEKQKEAEKEKIEEIKEEQTTKEKKKFKFWPFGKKERKKIEEIKEEKEDEEIKIEEKEDEQVREAEENFFSKLIKKIKSSQLTQDSFNEIFQDLELILLENNTALEAVDKIRESLAKDLVKKDIKKDKAESTVIESLKSSILSVLIEPPNLLEQIKEKNKQSLPFVILFFGINGSGKTTSIAKLAYQLKQQNISCVLAAADTFRAAAIDQLRTHAEKIDVPIIAHDYGSDPAAVAFDAIKYANQHKIQTVLIDTAGRMYTKSNLMKEMEKIVRISKPDLKIFVGESITGNDAIEQAKTFNEAIGIDGIILSKTDVDEKAGTILSVSQVTNKPIYFLGTGQSYSDLKPFTKSEVLKNLGLE